MAKYSCSVLLTWCIFLSAMIIISSSSTANGGGEQDLSWLAAVRRPGCQGTVAECMENDDDEFSMDSEINRRILATTQYISYGALQRNTVPCSQRGQSYYNCVPGQANPYTRGCSAITRCREG
ncbi:Protein RALF-like 33 [Turnera subulata]|uniref:Protein RALF-like 33 n=1 Tax=Turnera subulata TaxID=218843 RepID=A0A9Q0GKD9_9ROSI|nr:Protein RALF-like 33 [Turnera subulata]